MTNHVHLILKPNQGASISKAIAETHRRYTRMINFLENWRGFLWQGCFSSYPMDERYLFNAVSYVELNPVKAKMVTSAGDYRWSSAKAHLSGNDHQNIIDLKSLIDLCEAWAKVKW